MNISTMAIGNPPSAEERQHLNANYRVFEMLNGMRRKQMILESLKADQILTDACLPAGFGFRTWPLWRTTRNAQMYGEMLIDLPLKLHCLGWCHMFMNLLFAIYLSISYTLSKIYHLKRYYFQSSPSKKNRKNNTERCPTPHFSLLKAI